MNSKFEVNDLRLHLQSLQFSLEEPLMDFLFIFSVNTFGLHLLYNFSNESRLLRIEY